jgi:hypothetical protein
MKLPKFKGQPTYQRFPYYLQGLRLQGVPRAEDPAGLEPAGGKVRRLPGQVQVTAGNPEKKIEEITCFEPVIFYRPDDSFVPVIRILYRVLGKARLSSHTTF